MAIETANDHPLKVSVVQEAEMYANDHPYKVAIVGGSAGGNIGRVVEELPEEGETGYIYLVKKEKTEEGDVYDEYLWALQEDGETYDWESIGATDTVEIKLYSDIGANTDGAMTQKATTDKVLGMARTLTDNYYTKAQIDAMVGDIESALNAINNGEES